MLKRRALATALVVAAVLAGYFQPWKRFKTPALESMPLARSLRVDGLTISVAPADDSEARGPGIAGAGALEALERRFLAVVDWRPGDVWGPGMPDRVAAELKRRFLCVLEVSHTRMWRRHAVRFEVALRRPVAAVASGGEARMLLGEAGGVFEAPEGIFEVEGLPEVDFQGPRAGGEIVRVAGLFSAARRAGALPSPLVRLTFVPAEGVWSGELRDGTRIQWGRLRWTGPKLSRLREVLADAVPRFGTALTADLRHFEDGKILIRQRQ